MLVILPGVMDVSWCRPPGLGYSKVNTAILRKYVFELSQIRFFSKKKIPLQYFNKKAKKKSFSKYIMNFQFFLFTKINKVKKCPIFFLNMLYHFRIP